MTNDKKPKRGLIGFMSVIACLFLLLLIASCQPTNAHTLTKLEVNNHASLK